MKEKSFRSCCFLFLCVSSVLIYLFSQCEEEQIRRRLTSKEEVRQRPER